MGGVEQPDFPTTFYVVSLSFIFLNTMNSINQQYFKSTHILKNNLTNITNVLKRASPPSQIFENGTTNAISNLMGAKGQTDRGVLGQIHQLLALDSVGYCAGSGIPLGIDYAADDLAARSHAVGGEVDLELMLRVSSGKKGGILSFTPMKHKVDLCTSGRYTFEVQFLLRGGDTLSRTKLNAEQFSSYNRSSLERVVGFERAAELEEGRNNHSLKLALGACIPQPVSSLAFTIRMMQLWLASIDAQAINSASVSDVNVDSAFCLIQEEDDPEIGDRLLLKSDHYDLRRFTRASSLLGCVVLAFAGKLIVKKGHRYSEHLNNLIEYQKCVFVGCKGTSDLVEQSIKMALMDRNLLFQWVRMLADDVPEVLRYALDMAISLPYYSGVMQLERPSFGPNKDMFAAVEKQLRCFHGKQRLTEALKISLTVNLMRRHIVCAMTGILDSFQRTPKTYHSPDVFRMSMQE